MIVIGKKWDRNALYIGRGTPLGNPFVMHAESMRDEVCNKYEVWFKEKVRKGDDVAFNEMLESISKAHREGKHVVLGCFCAPKRCHGNTIKNFIEGE